MPELSTDPVLILDLGNVVFSLNFSPFEKWFKKTFQGESKEKLHLFWEIYAEYEKGSFGDEEFLVKIKKECGASFEDIDFIFHWNTCWECDMPGLESWLDELNGAIPVHVLSNTNGIHMECFLREKKILQRFDRLFLSHEMGCRKPEAQIYEMVTQELVVDPASILFFDDRSENIEGAKRAGWKAEIFEGIEKSASRLEEHRGLNS